MSKLAQALVAACFVITGVNAHAFGPNGHMAAGTIADELLIGTKAAKQVRRILGSNLRTASVWADCAKGVNTTTFKYGGDGRFPECKFYENPASKKQMEAFVKRNTSNCTSQHNTEACHKQYHYTDVAIQRVAYEKGQVGTADQDIVGAINAAIAVLQDLESPEPFKIASKKEALRLLAHYVGDIHQPLHVGSVYLDASGQVVDPDEGSFDHNTETRGGNDLMVGTKNLHSMWDGVSSGPVTQVPPTASVMKQARDILKPADSVDTWAQAWATESLELAKVAYDGMTFTAEDTKHKYKVTLPAGYNQMRVQTQREQIIKAGARLAHILTTIWPDD